MMVMIRVRLLFFYEDYQ